MSALTVLSIFCGLQFGATLLAPKASAGLWITDWRVLVGKLDSLKGDSDEQAVERARIVAQLKRLPGIESELLKIVQEPKNATRPIRPQAIRAAAKIGSSRIALHLLTQASGSSSIRPWLDVSQLLEEGYPSERILPAIQTELARPLSPALQLTLLEAHAIPIERGDAELPALASLQSWLTKIREGTPPEGDPDRWGPELALLHLWRSGAKLPLQNEQLGLAHELLRSPHSAVKNEAAKWLAETGTLKSDQLTVFINNHCSTSDSQTLVFCRNASQKSLKTD